METRSETTAIGTAPGESLPEREHALLWRGHGKRAWHASNLSVLFLCFSVFTIITILGATDYYATLGAVNRARSWFMCLLWSLPTGFSWALLTPIILHFSRRWSFEKGQRTGTIFRHLALLIALGLVEVVLDLGISIVFMVAANPSSLPAQLEAVPSGFLSGVARAPVIYGSIAGFGATMGLYDRYLERVEEETRLKDSLARTRLQSLGTMLNPHFLFNTLNAIGPLSRKDAESTNRMIALLGGLLRYSLAGARRQMVPLKEEMDFIQDYLQIVKIRSSEPLDVERDIPEEALEVHIPSMILQPIVENAVRHGLARRGGPGRLTFRASVNGGVLRLEVEDDGAGLDEKKAKTVGFGLGLTRERIDGFYGKRGSLDLAGRPEGGVRATLQLPVLERVPECEEVGP